MSLSPSQVDDAAHQHTLIDGSNDHLKQSPPPLPLSSPPSDSLITLDGPLVHQVMGVEGVRVESGDILITTPHTVVQAPITPQIIHEKPEEKKGEKGGGKKPARRGRPSKKSLEDDKSGDKDGGNVSGILFSF